MCHSTLFNELTRKLMAFRCCSTLLYKDNASFYLFSFSSLYLIWNFCFTIFNWLLLQYIISLVIFPFLTVEQRRYSCNQSISIHYFSFTVTPPQIERLYSRFTSLDRNDSGTLSREDFLRIPELAINPLCDRIVHSFFTDSNDDRVNFRQFMQVLARFRTIKRSKENKLNSREEKLRCKLSFSCNISRSSRLSIL